MDVKVYRYDTRGVYEWGLGYVSRDKYNAWQKFWDGIADTKKLLDEELYFWRVVKPCSDFDCHILITTGGAIYLHPMSGEGVIQYSNCIERDVVFEELKRMMKVCAKEVGCSIDVYSKKGVVNYE